MSFIFCLLSNQMIYISNQFFYLLHRPKASTDPSMTSLKAQDFQVTIFKNHLYGALFVKARPFNKCFVLQQSSLLKQLPSNMVGEN